MMRVKGERAEQVSECGLTVVLHDVVVRDARDAGDGFGEKGEPEACCGGDGVSVLCFWGRVERGLMVEVGGVYLFV